MHIISSISSSILSVVRACRLWLIMADSHHANRIPVRDHKTDQVYVFKLTSATFARRVLTSLTNVRAPNSEHAARCFVASPDATCPRGDHRQTPGTGEGWVGTVQGLIQLLVVQFERTFATSVEGSYSTKHLQNKQTNILTCGPRKPLAESGPLGFDGNDRQKANNLKSNGKRLARMTVG